MKINLEKQSEYLLTQFKRQYTKNLINNMYNKPQNFEDEYKYLSRYFQTLFLKDPNDVANDSNFNHINFYIIDKIDKRIKRHPILFKLLFKV